MIAEENQNIRNLFIVRERKCLIQERAYEIWLTCLNPIRWISLFIVVILPAVASVSIFTMIDTKDWEVVSTSLLLVSGIVSGLHSTLKCDTHQMECIKLSKQYSALAAEYEGHIYSGETDLDSKEKLDNEFRQLNQGTLTTPPYWCIRRAEKKVKEKKYR